MESTRYPVIILTGGKSTRLGRDKASELLAGKSLLQRALDACESVAARYVLVTARGQHLPETLTSAPVTIVEDDYPETGPLGGIYTGLAALASQAETQHHALVVACDMPLLQPALLRELLRLAAGHDAVVPVNDGLPEPLSAIYSMACIEPARRRLERGAYKVTGVLDDVDALLVPEPQWRPFDPEGLSFLNVNREEDLERAKELMERA